MKPFQLICQNCNMQYESLKDFKAHVRSYKHKQEVTKLFGTALHKGPVYFPILVFLDYLKNPNQTPPLIGFDMVTMFITPEKIGAFYLCHVCEEQLSSNYVVPHLCSVEHYFNYLANTNPELLRFAWLNDSFSYLQSSAIKEYTTNGCGALRMFELPKLLLKRCKKMPYRQVMSVFSKTDKLTEHIQASIPQRKTIQEYIADPARTNPLLGINLLLEYSCPKKEGRCGYLCTLCQKKLSAAQIISHCISFDHIYWYLKAAHPDTLDTPKSSYSHYSFSFNKKILYLANRAQTLCPPTEIESVHLDLECFNVINASSYVSVLEKLQVIRRERNQSELKVKITPGERIVFAPEEHESSASTAGDSSAQQQQKKTQIAPVTQTRGNPICRILCAECDLMLNFIKDYKKHINGPQHRQKLMELFGRGQYNGTISQIKLYQYMWNRNSSTTPVIGLRLLTVFVQRQIQDVNTPFYLCHACELNIPVSSASMHVTSEHHCLNVFSYSKPDLVFLGCRNWLQLAKEEEQSQGKQKMVLQVCELSRKQFTKLRTLAYEKFMGIIRIHFPKLQKCVQVEKRVTLESYSKSSERKSPLLGLQFVVKYAATHHYFKCGYLCLLCEKTFPERHAITHVLSFSHIYAYLDLAHPGSLSKEDSEQESLILDLAQQAEKITPNMTLQKVDLSVGVFNEIEKNSFMSAVSVLQEVFKDKRLGELKPSVVPGARLVSSFKKEKDSSKCELQGHTSSDPEKLNTDETCTVTPMPKTEENTNSKHPDPLQTEHEKPLKSMCITSTQMQPAKPSNDATTDLSLKSSQPAKEQSEPLKLNQKPLNQEKHLDQTVKHPQLQDSSIPQQQSTELGQKTAVQKPVQSPACLIPADLQTQLSSCSELKRYLSKPDRQPVIGLKTVIECCTVGQKPFYMCVTCVERYEENAIIKHLLSHQHRLQYLESMGICDPDPGKRKVTSKWLQAQADMMEKTQGSGEAETLNLDAEDYHEILSAPIVNALDSLRLSLSKLASEIDAQSPDLESEESHGSETFKRERETEEKDIPHAHLKKTVKFTKADKEPETRKQNSDDPARSSPHLWSYLTSPTRTEPIIGLSTITEYRNSNGQHSFLCSCCKVILATQSYMGHLISPRHRFNYIKSMDPEFVVLGKDEIKISELKKKAQIVQDTEGWGCIKVVEKENKEPPKKPSKDVEMKTPAKVQKQEPSQTISETEPQDLKSSETKPTEQQNGKETNSAEVSAVTDSQNSANTQKLEPSQNGHDAGEENMLKEPQDHNNDEAKPTKQQIKKKLRKHDAVIGLNFVTCVRHDKKKLFFCELCSARGHLDHLSSETHRKAYVEHKYPGCIASGKNMKKQLNKIALSLAAVERRTGMGMKKLNVPAKVFTSLRTAPISEALSHLKVLQTKQEDGVDLKTPPIPQPEPSTFTEHGTLNNSVHHMTCSAAATQSVQQEKSPSLDNPVTGPVHMETGQSVSTLFAESKGANGSELAFPCTSSHLTRSQSVLKQESKHLHGIAPSETYYIPVLGQSNASMFLNVRGLSNTVIGLSSILECRGISQPTFFLCLNCAEKFSREKFCNHMTSERHQYATITTQYQEVFQQWQRQTIHQMTIRDLTENLALTEKGLDAKVIKLNKDQYESLSSADFHDAIEILQRMCGPCMDESAQLSHLARQNQRSNEISRVKSTSESVEAVKERAHQSHKSCENTRQMQELHRSQEPIKEFSSGRNSTACTSLQSQNSPKALPESKAQTPQPKHHSVVQTNLAAKSNSGKPSLHPPKPVTQRTMENSTIVNSPNHTDLKYITKHRTEADAVVGLSTVIECRSEGQASVYLCVSCSTKLDHGLINYHLVKFGHRYSYLRSRYPYMFEYWSDSDSKHENSKKLMEFAHKVEMANEDEPGQLQVIKLNCDDLTEIKAMSYDKAIIHLQKIRREQNLCALKTCITPKIKKNLIKQERIEIDVTTQCSLEQPVLHGPKKVLKRRAVQQDLLFQSIPGKKQCSDVPSSHFKQFPPIENNQEPSDCTVKQSKISGSDSDSVTQFQQESSILTTANPNRSSYSATVPDISKTSLQSKSVDHSSQTHKRTTSMHKTVLKNCEKKESSSSITAQQQKDSSVNTNTVSTLSSMKGQEIGRVSEKRPLVKKSSCENAWNYENRQFSPETPSMSNKNPVAENSTETVAMKQQGTAYSVNDYNEVLNPRSNWTNPDKYLVSSHGAATSVTTYVTPEYAITHQYAVYKHPDYPSDIAASNTAMNYESVAPGISTNATDLINANSAHTSHTVYPGLPVYQQVHQPVQSFKDPEIYSAYYACYPYNQALHINQTAADDENVTSTPALEHGVYPLASWPQVSPVLTSCTKKFCIWGN
ncbi:uncharacterized protein si:ch211-199g17.2 isoform X2 [Hemibagrus wyckioides]|uniref:uncharacterized protein si:ch211-199g17.2 isoform X2 n=1 Tax=Hemibagrus wyckioides TaxID=337641 RepID=UPI00266C9D10|nr:uncharacterized protein si:ch211-199g17.2 isoform X2 [Hemibagrus wyckioides]